MALRTHPFCLPSKETPQNHDAARREGQGPDLGTASAARRRTEGEGGGVYVAPELRTMLPFLNSITFEIVA